MSERPVWAPWRIEYITGPKSGDCIFCLAARGEHSEHVIERGTRCLTLLNAFPYTPGHVMVAPHRHVGSLEELADDELLELMQLARSAVGALRAAMAPGGYNVGLNLGTVAGAGIADHLHLHVVPRWQGDTSFMPLLADTHVIPQALTATRDVLTKALARERADGPAKLPGSGQPGKVGSDTHTSTSSGSPSGASVSGT
jgi:ATP adenylyltransferase